YSVPGEVSMVGVADVNGDGNLDLVDLYVLSNGQFTAVFLGNGDGSFRPLRSSPGAFGCALADLNGDGRSDLVGGFGIQFANPDGTFQPVKTIPGLDACPAVADFNRDGKLDLTIPARSGVSLLFGNGDGTFQSPVSSNLGIRMESVSPFLVADFNGDGRPDLFVKQNQTVGTVLLNSGKGTFSSAGAAS